MLFHVYELSHNNVKQEKRALETFDFEVNQIINWTQL